MDVTIVTGASKGIGFELMKQLQTKGHHVIGIARTNSQMKNHMILADLANLDSLQVLVGRIIEDYKDKATSFTLINNAGVVEPIGYIGNITATDIPQAITINLTAPMMLSSIFISKLKEFKGTKRILNISSGAGRNPIEGWGTYCTTKAGLDHFSRVVALEQKSVENPVGIVSIAPGIIDTGMQETIRSSSENEFPDLQRFIQYKEEGHLQSAQATAQKLIKFLEYQDFTQVDPIVDIRSLD